MWKLVIEDDESKRTVVPLTRDDYTIGRQEGNTIRLTERNVSRDHGRIFRRRTSGPNGGTREVFLVEDRKSYNGIFVNGLRVAQAQDLQNGDLIQIGDYRLVLQDDTANQTTEITAITVTTTDFDAKTTIPLSAPTPYRAVTLTDRPNRFVMLVGPSPGVEFPLDRERMTIGRAEDANISVNHNSVSRLHCEVHALGDGRYEIVDKGSSNGVRVNAVELRRSIIEAGDFIELGDVRFKFVGAGQVFVPGPHESQQLTAISDREADLVDPTQRSWGGYAIPIVGAGILGAGLILAFVYVLRTRAVADTPPNTTLTSGDDEQALVAGAKRTCKIDDCDAAHDQVGKLGAASPWRKSIDFQQVESMWADSMLRKAQSEVDPTAKRAILQRVATAATVDAPRRKQASDLIAGLDQQTTASAQPTVTQEPTNAPVVLPPPLPPPTASPPTPPRPHVTNNPAPTNPPSPPVTHAPPPPPPPPPATTSKPGTSTLERAYQAARDDRPGEVRQLLEGKVRGGYGSAEEVRLVRGACFAQGDMACVADIKQKYPK